MKIKVKNHGIVRNAEIEFVPGLNIIKGESGAGKSTILRGIEAAIFNHSGDSFVTQGETTAKIEIDYNNHNIQRIRTGSGTKYILDGEELDKVGKTPVKDVLTAFGIKEIKTDSSSIRPNFLSQFSTPFLVDEKPSKIFEYLTITSSAVNLKDVEEEISSDISTVKQQKKTKEDTLTTLKKLILSSSKILEHKQSIDCLNKELTKFNEKQTFSEKLENIVSKIENVKSKIEYQKNVISLLSKNLDIIHNNGIKNEDLYRKLNTIKNLEKTIATIESLNKRTTAINKTLQNYESNIVDIDKNKIENKLEKIRVLQDLVYNITNKHNDVKTITARGLDIKKELDDVNNQIKDFKRYNIPIIVVSTNESLASSLNISRKDIVDILNSDS